MSYSNVIRCAAGLLGALLAAQSLAAAPDDVVCRDVPRPGSRIVMHLCATRLEWAASAQRTSTDRRVVPRSAALPPAFAMAFPHLGGGGMNTSPSTSFQRY
jgi:hypothetical protein